MVIFGMGILSPTFVRCASEALFAASGQVDVTITTSRARRFAQHAHQAAQYQGIGAIGARCRAK
jgi:hypothetical protein